MKSCLRLRLNNASGGNRTRGSYMSGQAFIPLPELQEKLVQILYIITNGQRNKFRS